MGEKTEDGIVGSTRVAIAGLAVGPVQEVEVEEEMVEGKAMVGRTGTRSS